MTYQEYKELLELLLKLSKKDAEKIPDRIINKSIENISKHYAEAYKKLYKELLDVMTDNFGIGANPSQSEMMSVIAQIESRLDAMNKDLMEEVKKEVQQNYIVGNAVNVIIAEKITEMAILETFVPYSLINTSKAEQLIADTMDDLLYVTQNSKYSVKIVVRDIFNKHLTLAGLNSTSHRELMDTIRKELTKQGMSQTISDKAFIGIIDKAGRKWQLKTYVDMAVKTKMEQAYHEGMKDDARQNGRDLAVISRKGAEDACKYFEGIIISMTGQSEGFMTYDQLKATGLIFHPNCRHNCFPVGKLSLVHPDDLALHERQMKKAQSFMKKIASTKKSKKKSK